MRYFKEKTDIEFTVRNVFPIIGACKCKFCHHFFIREFGFRLETYSVDSRAFNVSSLKHVYACKSCAKTKKDVVNLFNENIEKFKYINKPPMARFKPPTPPPKRTITEGKIPRKV